MIFGFVDDVFYTMETAGPNPARRYVLKKFSKWTSDNYSAWSSSSECGTRGEVCYHFAVVIDSVVADRCGRCM